MYIFDLKKNDIRYLKSVGKYKADLLVKLNIHNVYDLINHFPFRYEDRRKIVPINRVVEGIWQTVKGKVVAHDSFKWKGRKILKIIIADNTGHLSLVCYNRSFLKNVLKKETMVYISSNKFSFKFNELQTYMFDYEIIDEDDKSSNIHTGRIVPIYHTTENINVKYLRKLIYNWLINNLPDLEEHLPDYLIKKYKLPELKRALYKIHFPGTLQEAEIARKRLAFDKLFLLELNMALEKNSIISIKKQQKYNNDSLGDKIIESLPFKLTSDQIKVINEIKNDMKSRRVMNRLLMGDVGSGKTLVAVITALLAIENGYQAALMVPTEILAAQHYNNIKKILEKIGVEVLLLTGKQKGSEKKKAVSMIKDNKGAFIVGTHALIQEDVEFNNLSYIIIDEQHRFGVNQRASLHLKGVTPDVLVMTATPIPRTLSLTVYGDLDISLIKEMPPGRKPVITKWYSHNKLNDVYSFLKNEMNKGHQVYVVYPLVKESESMDLKDAESMYREFKDNIFAEYKVGLIHGQMKKKEKDEIMKKFRDGEINLLVATTVIEVGVDVANATVMVIEHAERFGLAQLHQLRGRIGRSELQSYCLLLTGVKLTDETKQRMRAMVKYNDGFKLAEIDLELRGPGEVMGTRQTGLPNLAPADIVNDLKILEAAKQEAFFIVNKNPSLDTYPVLKDMVKAEYSYPDKINYIKIS